MGKNKKVIGICLAAIHDTGYSAYLNRLHCHAKKQNYKLLIFHSSVDDNREACSVEGSEAVFELLPFDIVDALILLAGSFSNPEVTERLIGRAHACGTPVILINGASEGCFSVSGTFDTSFRSVICDTDAYDSFAGRTLDTVSAALGNSMDCMRNDGAFPDFGQSAQQTSDSPLHAAASLYHALSGLSSLESLTYSWTQRMLDTDEPDEFFHTLSDGLLPDSFVCLNSGLLEPAKAKKGAFTESLDVISSRSTDPDPVPFRELPLSELLPDKERWADDSAAYLIQTLSAEREVIGYYAVRADYLPETALAATRVAHALNLTFRVILARIRQANRYPGVKQGALSGSPIDLLIDKNLFHYYFQPIVYAHNGAIFAYEALMRTNPVISMTPLEVIDAASSQGRLYDIELATMRNTLSYVREHSEEFADRKLFVNSIPAYLLNEQDWNTLVDEFNQYMSTLVIEMTEQSEMDDERLASIKNRLQRHNIALAIDDYGTGFSNISNLIRYSPKYIKIDRMLIENIHENPKMQRLVAGIIEFVHENGYFALAEGVETHEELKTMITLGADLIQGYYLAIPKPYILRELPEELCNEIITLNLMRSEHAVKVFCPKEGDTVDLSYLATKHYNAILVATEQVTIRGVRGTAISCSIMVKDGLHTHMTFRDVNITTEREIPLIDLGSSTEVTITLEGENELINRGIRVPQSSSLHLTGSGALHIHSEMLSSYGIGNGCDSSYGSILIDCTGPLNIDTNGENSVAIGGGKNTGGSVLQILNSNVRIECSGGNCVAIGNFDGSCNIEIKKSTCSIRMACAYSVGIGSMHGSVTILLEEYKLSVAESGISLCGIGVLSKGSGSLTVNNGSFDCDIRGRNIICCGSNQGELDCTILFSTTRFYCEGNVVTGIGDFNGHGNITLRDTAVTMRLLARDCFDICSKYGRLETINIRKEIKVNE